jgi:hypothetical protein
MKKLLLLPTILVLVSCQPTELERCIEANMPELNTDERNDMLYEILKSYEIVFPDESSQEEFYDLYLSEKHEHLGHLISKRKLLSKYIEDGVFLESDMLLRIFKKVFDYNIKYYDINEEVIVETRYKKTATNICNLQGIY